MKRHALARHLRSRVEDVRRLRAVTGFDGFVDEMITLVDERQDLESYRRVEDIARFADLVKAAAGQSSLREIVVTDVHPGGCAVNMGDGLSAFGVAVDTFATLGEPVHPAFADYGRKATLHSWGREPGRTLAFEFADGKLMFSAVTQLAEFEPERVREHLQDGAFAGACQAAPLIALTDWTLYPHMTAVWRLLQEAVFSRLDHQPWLLVDLVDPSSRSEADIRAMVAALPAFTTHTRTVLGLNQNEANVLSRLLGIAEVGQAGPAATAQQAAELRSQLKLSQVVVHAHRYAVCARPDAVDAVDGPYCGKPKKSTGAGDRFNAGYALGLMLEMEPADCLLAAVAASGFFVRQARSASLEELAGFLEEWTD
jgi:sugar/nucleoside kinase (ribokinase family)